MNIGDELPAFRVASIDPEAMKIWAAALHDPNAIHLDRDFVASKGLGNRVINQGPANLAYIINMLRAAFPECSLYSLDVRYTGNVFEGECVLAGGTITSAGETTTTCEVWLKTTEMNTVISGSAVLTSKTGRRHDGAA